MREVVGGDNLCQCGRTLCYIGNHGTHPPPGRTEDRKSTEKLLVYKLREVMLDSDLEEVTSKQLRLSLEKEMKLDLKEYRGFLDRNMLRILGQMEKPSQIHDYLYLVRTFSELFCVHIYTYVDVCKSVCLCLYTCMCAIVCVCLCVHVYVHAYKYGL